MAVQKQKGKRSYSYKEKKRILKFKSAIKRKIENRVCFLACGKGRRRNVVLERLGYDSLFNIQSYSLILLK